MKILLIEPPYFAEQKTSQTFPLRGPILNLNDPHPAMYQSLITSRGCCFNCAYCAAPVLSRGCLRRRSDDNVIREIIHLEEQFGITYLFFHDSVFSVDRKATISLCGKLSEQSVPFTCQTRTDCIDAGILTAMKQAGCFQIILGIESGCPKTLKKIGKETNLDAIRKSVRQIQSQNIRCSAFFMIGFPWEDEQDIRVTSQFSLDLGLDAVYLFSAVPLPGTALWDLTGTHQTDPDFNFTGPGLNCTALPDREYQSLFYEIKAGIDHYNMRIQGRVGR